MIQHNDIYLSQLFEDIGSKVQNVLEGELYTEVEVQDQKGMKTYVEYYGIELIEPVTSYPSFLPFSQTVKSINDLIKSYIDDIHAYCKNLYNDESDHVLFFTSIDRLVCNVIEVMSAHYQIKMTILQIAIICNNIEHLKRSIVFYQSCAYKYCKNNAAFEFNYSAFSNFNQLKLRCEEKLYGEVRTKINEFVILVEDQKWNPKYTNQSHNEYIESIVEWLTMNIQILEVHNSDIVYGAAVTAMQHY